MVTNDATVLRIRHNVLYEVTELAWKGALDEKKEDILCKLIPGPQIRLHCCIYREREIIRQRVRLTEDPCLADGKNTTNIVQVIDAACEGYPIVRFMMTDNRRLCMGKACQNSCNFGAVSVGRDRVYIDLDKCKGRGKYVRACPYNAVADLTRPCRRAYSMDVTTMDENGFVETNESKYIQCGACIHGYPFDAIDPRSFMVNVTDMIRAGKKVVAMVAPATEGQLGADIIMTSWKTALKKIGSADMVKVDLDGDLTAVAEAAEWAKIYWDGKKMAASCCPVFVNVIRQHFPTLLENMSTTVSPMCTVSRILKERDPETVAVFIGPCTAKKSETLDLNIGDNTGYALTYSEIRTAIKAKNVNPEPGENIYQESSVFGKRFSNGGGVTAAILECLKETRENTDIKVTRYNGAVGCKKALMLLKVGRLSEDSIRGIVCKDGCVDGPSKHKSEVEARKSRDILTGQTGDKDVHASLKSLGATDVAMHRR